MGISNADEMIVLVLLSCCLVVENHGNPTCADLKKFPQIAQNKRQSLAILNVSSETGLLGCIQRCVRAQGCQSVSFDTNSDTCYQHSEDGTADAHPLQTQTGFLFTANKHWPRMSHLVIPSPEITNKESGTTEIENLTTKKLDRIPTDVVKEMVDLARFLAWYASNLLKGSAYAVHASNDAKKVTLHRKRFKEISPFSNHFNSLYVKMANATAWSTAHEKLGDRAKSSSLSKLVKDLYKEILETEEVTPTLANDLREICWSFGRDASNLRSGNLLVSLSVRRQTSLRLKKLGVGLQ